jgi:hypothetical protein
LSRETDKLSPLARRIVAVLGISVVVVLVALGALLAAYPRDALGTRFGRATCAFLGVFWLLRLIVQLYYRRYWPRGVEGAAAHVALVVIFTLQSFGYGGALLFSSRQPGGGFAAAAPSWVPLPRKTWSTLTGRETRVDGGLGLGHRHGGPRSVRVGDFPR